MSRRRSRSLRAKLCADPIDQRHREVLGRLLVSDGARGNLVPDAHLAALAIEHGLVLCSSDADFARFPGLRWDNPLIEPARRGLGRLTPSAEG
jgi:predicted nucleic acid-binding protein